MDIQNIKHIKKIAANETDNFQKSVNDLLRGGKYVLLQIGSDTWTDDQGRSVPITIAVLGSEDEEPQLPGQVVAWNSEKA